MLISPPPEAIRIELAGVPRGKGRPQFFVRRNPIGRQRALGTATDAKTRFYEGNLKAAGAEAMAGRPPLDGALAVEVSAHMPIPASWSRKKREAAFQGEILPTVKPDADNIVKLLDALNEVVFRDDKQIVVCAVAKYYSDRPRLIVQVWPL